MDWSVVTKHCNQSGDGASGDGSRYSVATVTFGMCTVLLCFIAQHFRIQNVLEVVC